MTTIKRTPLSKPESKDVKDDWTLAPRSAGESTRFTVLPASAGVLGKRRAKNQRQKMRVRLNSAAGSLTGSLPDLPPQMQVVLHVPFRIRCVSASSLSYAAAGPVTRAGFACMLGGICSLANTTFLAWASSFRIRKISYWPSAGQDAGLYEGDTGTAEQALSKESQKISTLPAGITSDKGCVFKPKPGTYLSMWQTSNINTGDILFYWWGGSGSVFDFEGTFTLCNGIEPLGVAVAVATINDVYYLSPDGNTTHILVPQGVPTTH